MPFDLSISFPLISVWVRCICMRFDLCPYGLIDICRVTIYMYAGLFFFCTRSILLNAFLIVLSVKIRHRAIVTPSWKLWLSVQVLLTKNGVNKRETLAKKLGNWEQQQQWRLSWTFFFVQPFSYLPSGRLFRDFSRSARINELQKDSLFALRAMCSTSVFREFPCQF